MTGTKQALLAAMLALASASVQAAEYGCDTEVANRHVLLMRGPIGKAEFKNFAAAFGTCFPDKYAGQVVVDLHSGGGSVDQALNIANALIAYGRKVSPVLVRVDRGSYCISACTYLFVAGTMREVLPGASLEPHGFSGYRGARMVTHAAMAVVKGKPVPALERISLPVVQLLAQTFGSFGVVDQRFTWLSDWLKEFTVRDLRRISVDAPDRLINGYLKMSEPQRRAVDGLESATTVVMTELERSSALRAFEGLLGPQRSAGQLSERETSQLQQWMLSEYMDSLNGYLAATKQGPPLKSVEAIVGDVRDVQAREIEDTRDTVVKQLWPYLATRDDVMDIPNFVRLMFSTSIIYTRPLTREELCDFNLDNMTCQ